MRADELRSGERIATVDERDLTVRNATYAAFVELGRAPRPSEVAAGLAASVGEVQVSRPHAAGLTAPADEVQASWRRLHDQHALVLDAGTAGLRMAHPFSAVPTSYAVQAAGRSWFANCAWDAFGICAALDVDGVIRTACPDCGAPVTVRVADRRPSDTRLVFHCLVPAAQWWDDIVFT
jgi:Alkylmercury lyase